MVNMQLSTEKLILETAKKHFVQKGFTATRTQEIADEAGINKAMLHYYFRSKEKLYQEIIAQTMGEIIPKFANALSSEGDFWDHVDNLVGIYIKTLSENPHIPIFIMSELSQKKESFINEIKKHASFFMAIQSFVIQMNMEMESGRIRSIPPAQLLLNIISMAVFPFMAKPIFNTIWNASEEDFSELMKERKQIIMDFLRAALRPD